MQPLLAVTPHDDLEPRRDARGAAGAALPRPLTPARQAVVA
jgi:hypothetical protein